MTGCEAIGGLMPIVNTGLSTALFANIGLKSIIIRALFFSYVHNHCLFTLSSPGLAWRDTFASLRFWFWFHRSDSIWAAWATHSAELPTTARFIIAAVEAINTMAVLAALAVRLAVTDHALNLLDYDRAHFVDADFWQAILIPSPGWVHRESNFEPMV